MGTTVSGLSIAILHDRALLDLHCFGNVASTLNFEVLTCLLLSNRVF